MKTCLLSLDLDIMQVVTSPFEIPKVLSDTVWPLMALNIKTKTALYSCLTDEEFTRVTTCKTAYEIWTKLELAHEGSTQVKESKINLSIMAFLCMKIKLLILLTLILTRLLQLYIRLAKSTRIRRIAKRFHVHDQGMGIQGDDDYVSNQFHNYHRGRVDEQASRT